MPRSQAHRGLLAQFGLVVRTGRQARGWTQRRLANVVGVSQSRIARLEQARFADVGIVAAARVLDALDGRIDVRFVGPAATARPNVRDQAHARCTAYVASRMERGGWEVATEVAIDVARWHTFADVLAFHTSQRILVIVEVKTEIHDLGEIDRQLGLAERGAWDVAHQRGWRPRAVTAVLAVLATSENDRRLVRERDPIDRGFRLRARDLQAVVQGAPAGVDLRQRGLAMIDPATRRRAWLLPTAIDGRRTPARYADRAAFLRARR